MKGSIAGFVALQISAFFVYLIILAITNSIKNARLAAAAEEANLLKANSTRIIADLAEIEAILEEASEEFRQNGSNAVLEEVDGIITYNPSALVTTPSPSTNNINHILLLTDDQPIISIYQIIVIVLGGIVTFAYTAVVIMYFREIDTDNTRIRPARY